MRGPLASCLRTEKSPAENRPPGFLYPQITGAGPIGKIQ